MPFTSDAPDRSPAAQGRAVGALQAIGRHYGSDKFCRHDFAGFYESILAARREEPLRLLEIGIGGEAHAAGGESLMTWRDYLPRASIVGIDIYDKSWIDGERIVTRVRDQTDEAGLQALVEEFGPFDFVVDDGSHVGSMTARALFVLFPLMAPGGWYVIEDIQTSYWGHYGGSSLFNGATDTAVRWLKLGVDLANRDEFLDASRFPLAAAFDVAEVRVAHNIGALRRARTNENLRSRVLTDEMRARFLAIDRASNAGGSDAWQECLVDPGRLRKLMEAVEQCGGVDEAIRRLEI